MSGSRRREPLHAETRTVETLEHDRDRLREQGRHAIGITGAEDASALREVITRSGVGWYPMIALGLLVMVDEFQSNAVLVLGPEITASLGISRSSLAGAIILKTLVLTVAALPIAALVQRKARRGLVSVVTAFGWSILTVATGFVANVWGLLALLAANGATGASVRSVHEPLLLDSYPPEARVRAMSFYRGADSVGRVAAPVIIGVLTVAAGLTWRGVFVGLGAVCVLAAVVAHRLRDPGFGRWDTEQVRDVVRGEHDVRAVTGEPDVSLGVAEISRRLFLIPTVRKMLAADVVVGMLLVPFITYLSFFLHESWGMGPGGRSVFSAVTALFGVAALAAFGPKGEDMFRADPARLVRLSGTLLAAAIVAISVAIFTPVFLLMVALFGLAFAMIAVLTPALNMAMFAIVPATMRPHLAALAGIALAGVGGTTGLFLLSGVDRRYGTAGAILSLAGPGVVGGLLLRNAARTVNDDVDRMVGEIIEEEDIRRLKASGARMPLLACQHIDFAYTDVQVLFDVSFTVREGEMVALLGTNGAGKSTLLRVISGLGLPSGGSVRFDGADITFVDAQRRVGLGIRQMSGGRATFPSLTVVDNLRASAYSVGRNRRSVEGAIDDAFALFPRLAERRNQTASQLSGGENQMLALGAALVVEPKLLLIDELSLGLAPKVVGELLDVVRQLNQTGTAVVLVEQSVNIALSLVDHAYFMEKGAVRFDGKAADLIGRDDLLRSVFLEGATRALVPTS